jgi:hypothetical protein
MDLWSCACSVAAVFSFLSNSIVDDFSSSCFFKSDISEFTAVIYLSYGKVVATDG